MIDWARIETLETEIGADGVSEVLEMFSEEIEERLQHLKGRHLTAEDAHFLKGSALNLGLMNLAELSLRAEKALKTGQICDVAVSDLAREYSLGIVALRRRMPA